MRPGRIIFVITLLLCAIAPQAKAQEETYKFDIGAQVGMSGYLGDANRSNIFKHPGFSAGFSARYQANARWCLRAVLSTMTLSGNTADFDDVLPGGREYSFKSQAFDLSARWEFNFFPYGIGETYKKLKRWSPYLTLGVGATLATCDGVVSVAPCIPMGFGVKYKLKPRVNVGVEFTMTKVFGDKIDGELYDLYQIKSSFVKNTDWYSNISVSVSYEFGERCVTCHYVD